MLKKGREVKCETIDDWCDLTENKTYTLLEDELNTDTRYKILNDTNTETYYYKKRFTVINCTLSDRIIDEDGTIYKEDVKGSFRKMKKEMVFGNVTLLISESMMNLMLGYLLQQILMEFLLIQKMILFML